MRDAIGKNWRHDRAIMREVERRYADSDRCVTELLDRWSEDDWRQEDDPVIEGRFNEKKSRVEYRWPPVAKRNPRAVTGTWLRGEKRDLRNKDKKTRTKRDVALKRATAQCGIKRGEVRAWCSARRAQLRTEARGQLDKTKRRRAEVQDTYDWERGRATAKAAPKMSKAESDSLAEHNIDARYMGLWREVRHLFPYSDAPDKRAELFGEWLEEHESEATAWELARVESIDYGAAEAAHYAATG